MEGKNRVRIILILGAIILTFIGVNAQVINSEKLSDRAIQLYEKMHDLDSVINDCHIYMRYNREGSETFRIVDLHIYLNDTVSIVRTLDKRQRYDSLYSQVTLTKPVADCFKTLLFDLYSRHQSILQDSVIDKSGTQFSVATIWSIDMNVKGQNIEERINLIPYNFTYKKPYNPQFEKILELIWAIKRKMEYDIYSLKDDEAVFADWVLKSFNGNYYNASDIIY